MTEYYEYYNYNLDKFRVDQVHKKYPKINLEDIKKAFYLEQLEQFTNQNLGKSNFPIRPVKEFKAEDLCDYWFNGAKK